MVDTDVVGKTPPWLPALASPPPPPTSTGGNHTLQQAQNGRRYRCSRPTCPHRLVNGRAAGGRARDAGGSQGEDRRGRCARGLGAGAGRWALPPAEFFYLADDAHLGLAPTVPGLLRRLRARFRYIASLAPASFDLVAGGSTCPPIPFTDEVYALIARALAPSGTFAFQELVFSGQIPTSGALPAFRQASGLPLALKLAGFVSPSVTTRSLSEEEVRTLASGPWASQDVDATVKAALDGGLSAATITASKPSYATGSAAAIKLPLRKKLEARPEVRSPPPAVIGWSDNSDEGELEDEEALLDEADRAKPAKGEPKASMRPVSNGKLSLGISGRL